MPVPAAPTAVILTALEVETRAVLRHLSGISIETVSGTGFFRGHFDGWEVAVAEVGPGNVSVAAITVRACERYKPNVALFVGVAGGVKDVALGDVVVATKVYGYESGKDKAAGFQARPALLNSSHSLEQRARIVRQIEDWRARLDPGIAHSNPTLFVEPIAAGEKVVASKRATTAKLVARLYGDALAVEMEGRGFLEGVHINHPAQGCVIRGISDLLSGKATADRAGSQRRAADAAAAVAFQMLSGLAASATIPSASAIGVNAARGVAIDVVDLKALATALLEAGAPPSISMLFPGASSVAREALESAVTVERTVIETNPSNGGPVRTSILLLGSSGQRRHLIVGPPGSGKTHALWHAAGQLLHRGDIIPLYLPAGQIGRWDDLASIIREAAPKLPLHDVLDDPRVCFLIDGWSEFAAGEHVGEKQKTVRALRDARVIADGRAADVGDTLFKVWSLELLPPRMITDVLDAANPGAPPLPVTVLDLLRLPLLLSIYVLSDVAGSATGELLRQLHDHLARDLPEGFTAALAEAVAASELSGDRAYGRLVSSLQAAADKRGISEPTQLLRRLGTIVERHGRALPIHDLYWSWLAGRGLMVADSIGAAIDRLNTRESYHLALQSGAHPRESDISATVNDDLVFAATLDAGLCAPHPDRALTAAIDYALKDSRLAVRSRGGLAALEGGRSAHLRGALDALSALSAAKLYVPDWPAALQPQTLFPQRATLADWIGSDGTDFILSAIAERGGPEWIPWLEQMASAGKITRIAALAAALGCGAGVPAWGHPHLDDLFRATPWALRAAATRRSNIALARHIGANYERLVDSVVQRNSSAWIDLNRVLVSCGDDALFENLLSRFATMTEHAQELLGYAVVERGQPWIAAFQKIAFAKFTGGQHHKLAEMVSPEIDDATARAWIDAGHYEEGWRVLIARHNEEVLPELLADLPPSFADLHHIPSLAVMRFLDRAPASLPGELLRRLGSPMQPKAMQDVLNAMAKAYPTGVPAIVQFVSQQPDAIPSYHVAQAVRLYETWREQFGGQLFVRSPNGELLPFPRWIASHCAHSRWDRHFTAQMLSLSPDLAIDMLLNDLKDDVEKAAEVLEALALKGVKSYDADLLDYMLAVPRLAKLIPNVFQSAFDTFPAAALHSCLASPDVDQNFLTFRLSATSNPLHRSVHAELIHRVLVGPFDLNQARYIAHMMRGHIDEDANSLLQNAEGLGGDNWLWLVREVELARGQRLINEQGEFRRQ